MVTAVLENGSANVVNGGLMLPDSNGGAIAVYGRIKDPMEFINGMGKVFSMAGACGVKTENEGKVLALACMCKGVDPFELQQDYHIIDGKLSMRADTMLAKFRERGGKHRWIKDGTDGITAELELTDRDGNKIVSKFDIDKAKAAGYVKDGSQWKKRPDQMLRARCTSDGIRMIAPEVNSGRYTPEELDDSRAIESTATAAPIRSAAEVEQRRKELQGQATGGSAATVVVSSVQPVQTSAAPVADENVVDAVIEPTEKVPFGTNGSGAAESPATQAERIAAEKKTYKLAEIEDIANKFGTSAANLIAGINKRDGSSYATLDDLPDDKADSILEKLRQKLDAKNNTPRERQPGEEG